ncbi:unnamed protein product [Ceutorhynchus assimilis]|uniref:Cytosolic non-specific dipeptidase n=1 Tax=Ceutorhynchus assimilis TaxID=467358 RepID=A0A9N9QQE2_9CUCU|nr:unnamed protein product [Ceutorhynchus assimilis]
MVFPHLYRAEHSETNTTNGVYGDYYAKKQSKKIGIQKDLLKILNYIDSHRNQFLDKLADIIQIKSVSGRLKYQRDVQKMVLYTETWLKRLRMKYECFDIGTYNLEGETVRVPSIILASLEQDSSYKTICAYLHMDVPDPDMEQWKTNPFELTLVENGYYGNGVACGKGYALMWFHVIEAFQKIQMPLPVNIKFIIEFMHHENSIGLSELLQKRKQDFFCRIYCVIICESEWIGMKYPCLVYGCAGAINLEISITKIEKSETDIKEDMEKIANTLVDADDNVLIKGFDDLVEDLTPDEENIYEELQEFDIETRRKSLPESKQSWDQVRLLMDLWRHSSLYLHENLECICEKRDSSKIKKVITAKVVPKQDMDKLIQAIENHIQNVVKDLKIQNEVRCEVMDVKRYWIENFRRPCFIAVKRALTQIYKEVPNMIRRSTVTEALTVMDRTLEKPIVMVPLSRSVSRPGKCNENITYRNYIEGTKVIAAILFQISYTTDVNPKK